MFVSFDIAIGLMWCDVSVNKRNVENETREIIVENKRNRTIPPPPGQLLPGQLPPGQFPHGELPPNNCLLDNCLLGQLPPGQSPSDNSHLG